MNKTIKLFDLHLDLQVYLEFADFLNMKYRSLNILDTKRHGDIPQFLKSGLKFAIVNIFPFEYVQNNWLPLKFEEVMHKLSRFLKWIKRYKMFKLITNSTDLQKIESSKNIGIILGVEGLNFLNKPEDVFKLYESGIRVFGLNWNIDSKFSSSLKTLTQKGLTKMGIKLIYNLQKINSVLDLAHSSIYTSYDVFKYYKKPAIFSHNGVKKIVDFEQNLDDKIIDMIKENKGLIGLTLLPYSIEKNGKLAFENWYLQFEYLKKRNLKNNIAIGTDFFGFKYSASHLGFKNYLDFYNSVISYKIPNYVLFENAFKFFKQML